MGKLLAVQVSLLFLPGFQTERYFPVLVTNTKTLGTDRKASNLVSLVALVFFGEGASRKPHVSSDVKANKTEANTSEIQISARKYATHFVAHRISRQQ